MLMREPTDPALRLAMASLSLPGLLIEHRLISPGDEQALMAEEAQSLSSSRPEARRASGAARIVARRLLAKLGHSGVALPRAGSGAPIWPEGVVGSLAHDCRVALAAVAAQGEVIGLGVDVEPAEPLPADMLDLVATSRERARLGGDTLRGRLLFVAKEAVYKALHPLDGIFLEHHDVEIDFEARRATAPHARVLELRWCVSTRLVALAVLRRSP